MTENRRRPASATSGMATMTPFVIVIVILGLALIGAIYMLVSGYSIQKADEPSTAPQTTSTTVYTAPATPAQPVASADQPAPNAEATKPNTQQIDPDSLLGKILLTVNNYYTAKTPEEKLNFIIDPDRLKDTVNTYYSTHPLKSRALRAIIEPPSSLPIHGVSFWKMRVGLDDGSQGFVAVRFVDKEPKIDWESEVRYSDYDWNQWLDELKDKVGNFRVYVVANNVYEAPFNDQTKFFSVKLSTMDSDRSIVGYLDLTNDDQRDLAKRLVMAQGTPMECVFTLKQTNGAAQVLKVVNDSWVVPTAGK